MEDNKQGIDVSRAFYDYARADLSTKSGRRRTKAKFLKEFYAAFPEVKTVVEGISQEQLDEITYQTYKEFFKDYKSNPAIFDSLFNKEEN
jgi:hypothetical protein